MLNPLHKHGDGTGIDLTILLGLINYQLLPGFSVQSQGKHLIVTPLEVTIAAWNGCLHGKTSQK